MSSREIDGVINTFEAYNKRTAMQRLGISQKFWDKMLTEGLPYSTVGHSRWVTGKVLIEHLSRNAERKAACPDLSQKGGSPHVAEARDR